MCRFTSACTARHIINRRRLPVQSTEEPPVHTSEYMIGSCFITVVLIRGGEQLIFSPT